jgi:hypothetical protein
MIWEFINLWEHNWNKMMNQVCLSKNFNFEHIFGTLISIIWSHRALKSSMFVGFYFSLKQINMIYFIATFNFFFTLFPMLLQATGKAPLINCLAENLQSFISNWYFDIELKLVILITQFLYIALIPLEKHPK